MEIILYLYYFFKMFLLYIMDTHIIFPVHVIFKICKQNKFISIHYYLHYLACLLNYYIKSDSQNSKVQIRNYYLDYYIFINCFDPNLS